MDLIKWKSSLFQFQILYYDNIIPTYIFVIIPINYNNVLVFLSSQYLRTQIVSRQKTHEKDVDQRIFVGLVHVAAEVRALDLVDNAGSRR